MGRTTCTEPQCLYRIAIRLLPSVPVQYSYTSTPLSACTVQLYLYSPQRLYSTAIPLLPSVPVLGCTLPLPYRKLTTNHLPVSCVCYAALRDYKQYDYVFWEFFSIRLKIGDSEIKNSEGPATGHLDTSFPWFPCVYKKMLRWFPKFQFTTTCFSFSPSDSSNRFHVLYTCKITTATGWQPNCS